ncbi:hypothetical protein [Alkaliphilus crotonatoxidans]
MMTEGLNYITSDFLRSFTGAVLITSIITHFVKDYFPESFDYKIITLGIAMIISVANIVIFEEINARSIYLGIINSLLVATAATGNYEILTKQTKRSIIRQQEAEKRKLSG